MADCVFFCEKLDSSIFFVLTNGDDSDFSRWLQLWAWCRLQLGYKPLPAGIIGSLEGVKIENG